MNATRQNIVHTALKTLLTATIGLRTIFLCQAQTSSPPKKRTVWVSPPAGSLLGGGFVDAGNTDAAPAKAVMTSDKASFRAALTNFDAQSGTIVNGWSLIIPAVAWQSGAKVETVKKQQATTGLSFGELLVANSLATGSGKSFNEILALKAKTKRWGEVAKQVGINIDSITARLRTASESIKFAESRRKRRREQNLRDTLNPVPSNPQGIERSLGGGG